MVDAARLSEMAPMIAGPMVKPKSRRRLVVALAMPARWMRTVLTATAVTEETANAKPMPTRTSGGTIGTIDRWSIGTCEDQKSPMAISAKPPPRSHFGLMRGIAQEMTGSRTSVKPWMSTKASAVLSGLKPWIADRRMLVAYAVPRKPNMPSTVTTEVMANARLLNSSRRSSGEWVRRSMAMNQTMNTTATTKPMMTCALPQPAVGPWMTANSSANSEMAIVNWPGQSSDRPSGDDELWAFRAEYAALISASTITARNAQRQLAFGSEPHDSFASAPPSTGETKPPVDRAAA